MSRQAPPAPKTRREQKEDTRGRVRAAALELFESTGFEQTTTKAVAERAGVAAGTVFVHARDKDDLLCLVMSDLLRDAVREGFARSEKANGFVDKLLAVFGAVFEMYGAHPKLALPFIRIVPGADGPNGTIVNGLTFEFLGRLGALASEARGRGELRADAPTTLVTQNVFALYFFALFSWVSGYVTIENVIDPYLRMSLELALDGSR